MPYYFQWDLFELIHDPDHGLGRMDDTTARTMLLQVITGLEHLHLRGIGHRDLSADNVLVDLWMPLRRHRPRNVHHVTTSRRSFSRYWGLLSIDSTLFQVRSSQSMWKASFYGSGSFPGDTQRNSWTQCSAISGHDAGSLIRSSAVSCWTTNGKTQSRKGSGQVIWNSRFHNAAVANFLPPYTRISAGSVSWEYSKLNTVTVGRAVVMMNLSNSVTQAPMPLGSRSLSNVIHARNKGKCWYPPGGTNSSVGVTSSSTNGIKRKYPLHK